MAATAKRMIQNQSMDKLLGLLIETGKDEYTGEEVYIVRGWILDELQARDPDAFDAWMESPYTEDVDALRFFEV